MLLAACSVPAIPLIKSFSAFSGYSSIIVCSCVPYCFLNINACCANAFAVFSPLSFPGAFTTSNASCSKTSATTFPSSLFLVFKASAVVTLSSPIL